MTSRIPHLDVGSGRRRGALTVFPVWIAAAPARGIEWKTGALEVGELDGGAEVSRLRVANRGARPTVLLEGDVLVGGKQHRMTVSSMLLPVGHADAVDVVCVEQGRWSGGSGHRSVGLRGAPSVRQSHLSRRHDAQGEVWRRVSRYDRMLASSATSSMVDHLVDSEDDTPIPLMSGQRGVVIGIGGRVIGAELFGNSRGLASRWDGILRAARLDARLAPAVRTPSSAARSFVRALGSLPLEDGGEAGMARAVVSEHGPLRIAGIRRTPDPAESPIHIAAFDDSHPLLELV